MLLSIGVTGFSVGGQCENHLSASDQFYGDPAFQDCITYVTKFVINSVKKQHSDSDHLTHGSWTL